MYQVKWNSSEQDRKLVASKGVEGIQKLKSEKQHQQALPASAPREYFVLK